MIRAFLDSDVILDFLLRRGPFAEPAGMIFSLGERGKLSLLTSTLSFMNVHYIATAATDVSTARSLAQRLRTLIELLPGVTGLGAGGAYRYSVANGNQFSTSIVSNCADGYACRKDGGGADRFLLRLNS